MSRSSCRFHELFRASGKLDLGYSPHVKEDLLRMARPILDAFQVEWYPNQAPPELQSQWPTHTAEIDVPMPQQDQGEESQDPYQVGPTLMMTKPQSFSWKSSKLSCSKSSSNASKHLPLSGVACRSLLLEFEILRVG
eukprot:108406-Amphidinium_carterae.3